MDPSISQVGQSMTLSWDECVKACTAISSRLSEIVLPGHRLPVLRVFAYRMPRGWQVNLHQHSYYEMSIILSGRALDGHAPHQRLGPGHVFVHGPNQPHHWRSPWGVCQRVVICFNVDPPVPMSLPKVWPCWSHLLPVVDQMLLAAHESQPGWEDRVYARLAVLLSEALTLGTLEHDEREQVHADTDFLAQRVDAFLDDNLSNPIRLPDVAANVGVSVSTLTHQYPILRGQTVNQRLVTLRLEQAAYLLRETDQSLAFIASAVGINQSAYFCRLFKKHFRKTPCQYRQGC